MNIREFKAGDLQGLKAILDYLLKQELSAKPKHDDPIEEGPDDFKATYGDERDILLVAEEDNQAIGFIAMKEDSGDTALLKRLIVHHAYRKRKYGTNLLHRALDKARIKGYKHVLFRSTEMMKPVLSLLLKNGFKENDFQGTEGYKIVELSKDILE